MNVIECKGLTKKYGSLAALDNLHCTIEENKITGLIGRNGAGKTTLLKMIAGFLQPTSGEIKVFLEKPFNNLFVSANVIFINDQMELPTALNLKDILMAAESFYKNWDAELAEGLFDYFSLNEGQYIQDLSKGMRSTFNMILGLASRCALTIFDEPTTGMDTAVRKDFYRALLKDYIAHPRTILISSHHLDEIEDLLEDILLLKEGKEHLHLPISDLKEWAIGLQGRADLIRQWTRDREVVHMESRGVNYSYAVVRNDYTNSDLQEARTAGLDLSQVSSSDLCVYLTRKTKGGIDDVFSKD
jgi:ABC-2 type transport system ATP-binding protein